MALPLLPPAFQLVALDRDIDAFGRAVRAAPRGLDDGTVYWTDRADRLSLAVALEPEAPAETTLEAVYVLTVAAGDALGALLPPQLPVAFAWPAGLVLDGAVVGRVRAALAPVAEEIAAEAMPPWLVLGLEVEIGPLGWEGGDTPERTTLADAGAGDVASGALAEAVCRHFLAWTHRWVEEGLGPVRRAWNERCFRLGEEARVGLGSGVRSGAVLGLDEDGRFAVGAERLSLAAALAELG